MNVPVLTSPVPVLHLIDALDLGGAERLAVHLANQLPTTRIHSHLMTTRHDGPLAATIAPSVIKAGLHRRSRFDVGAVWRLLRYLDQHQIKLIHAHGTAVFLGVLVALWNRSVRVIWHDHNGPRVGSARPSLPYRLMSRRLDGVIAVNEPLALWISKHLHTRRDRVWYIPNFVTVPPVAPMTLALPGDANQRIVSVANLQPVKDQLGLVEAFDSVRRRYPDAHLMLVGATRDEDYAHAVRRRIDELGLNAHITLLGARTDIPGILHHSAIGVLGSVVEGLPMALLEYGAARLPAIATNVGQCADVLDHGNAGIIVPPGSPDALANAMITLLASPARRQELAERFFARVQSHYSPAAVIEKVLAVYQTVLRP